MKDERLGSIRIADHNGRSRYRYKYNIRFDIKRSYEEIDRGIKRFYCVPKFYKKVILRIKEEMKKYV
jgi:hypothetical protein